MIEIAGGILLAAAVLAIVQSRTGAQIIVVLLLLGVLGVLYAIWGWTPIVSLGVFLLVTLGVARHEQQIPPPQPGPTIHGQYHGDDP